jgi:hypothetical protein
MGGQTRDFTYVENNVRVYSWPPRDTEAAVGRVINIPCGTSYRSSTAGDHQPDAGRQIERSYEPHGVGTCASLAASPWRASCGLGGAVTSTTGCAGTIEWYQANAGAWAGR